MAASALIAYTTGAGSASGTVGAGQVHTLIPIFKGKPGKVRVQIKTSDGSHQSLAPLTTSPTANKLWQLVGPLDYRVTSLRAGVDLDTGA